MAYPTSNVSLLECRSERELKLASENEGDKNDKINVRSATDDEVEFNESRLLNLPLDLLELVMDHCIGVEYMRFRATCKICHLAAPLIQWSNRTASSKLHSRLLGSPWLMLIGKSRKIINFIDPVFGDKYSMKRSLIPIPYDDVFCSRFGWLLFRSNFFRYVFFNPFTNDIRKLPDGPAVYNFTSMCFSAPPTSPHCKVIGFKQGGSRVFVHIVAGKQTWHELLFNLGNNNPRNFYFPTFCRGDLYVLCDKGEVYVLKKGFFFKQVAGAKSCEGKYFLVNRDKQLLLVIVGDSGEKVEVFKLNDYTNEWEKIESLGKYTMYIGGGTCVCIEAKSPDMENTIFFPRLHFINGKVVFYSLETRMYHAFNGKKVEDIGGARWKHAYDFRAWIEPTWVS